MVDLVALVRSSLTVPAIFSDHALNALLPRQEYGLFVSDIKHRMGICWSCTALCVGRKGAMHLGRKQCG